MERCAWQDYWFEKAADAGNVDAKSRYARSLIDRPLDAEWRKKAFGYFQSIMNDFDGGKLTADQEVDGILSKFWLGVMLCEGYHTQRDAIKGVKLIKEADSLSNGFEKFGFRFFYILGELYATGLAQPGEEPSEEDLEIAIKYLGEAIKRFNPDRDNPSMLDMAKQMFEVQKKRIVNKMEMGGNNTIYSGADERRKKWLEPATGAVKQRMDADKAALERLRQRLAREGW